MCFNGLLDLYEDKDLDLDKMVPIWPDIVVSGKQYDAKQNLALLLLQEVTGGQDLEKNYRGRWQVMSKHDQILMMTFA